ncbi:exo-beta-N-acetylmuramidase NamZ family protein [Halosolutus gelatinilyticus]|uniref:exo-beta-N-acetylmuramidase NamZ family protein n=1 Tax=Halosolutus gelatinilyticus TaxID=2931975 RepID=UPI001FF3984D|nr:DUF1343 domain-containing protein [Halosolutus gelatinilyticus]
MTRTRSTATLGVESFLERRDGTRPSTIGLVTNPSGVTSDLESTIDLFHRSDTIRLEALFGPTHGIRGNENSRAGVDGRVDERTGVPVYNLSRRTKTGSAAQIEPLDLLVYDIQEVGTRFYTFVQTLERVLSVAADAATPVVVLDRPNPIAPLGHRGGIADGPDGTALPIVHGMTIGELARFFNDEFGIDADLSVVTMDGWTRERWFDEYELPWVPPSPNMPDLRTALVYPGTCMFEGTNLSEGRGTTLPFELVGAPWIHAPDWATQLNELDLPGVKFRPAYFRPLFSKHERQDVEGVQIHVVDRSAFDPVDAGIAMLATVFREYSDCEWLNGSAGYVIDDLLGGSAVRERISEVRRGVAPWIAIDRLRSQWDDELAAFGPLAREYSIYGRS